MLSSKTALTQEPKAAVVITVYAILGFQTFSLIFEFLHFQFPRKL